MIRNLKYCKQNKNIKMKIKKYSAITLSIAALTNYLHKLFSKFIAIIEHGNGRFLINSSGFIAK